MKVSIIGQGYVGLSLAVRAAEVGHLVVGYDSDDKIVSQLLLGNTHIPDVNIQSLKKLLMNGTYCPSADPKSIKDSEIIIIAVPTPLDDKRNPNLEMLRNAAIQISEVVERSTLIVNESTSYPGTLRNVIKDLIENKTSIKHLYAAAPERIDPGNPIWQLSNTPRVLGAITNDALKFALEFYETICSTIYTVSDPETAEASKLFENTFRHVNIALVNEFAMISKALSFSATEAINASATKPFGFMPFLPSVGVGGHCIPVDPSYLSYASSKAGVAAKFIELANSINIGMTHYIVDEIVTRFEGSIENVSIQLAGIAYKSGVPDLRESPAIELLLNLRGKGAKVSWHDPLVGQWNNEISQDLDSMIDLGIIVSPHKQISFEIWRTRGVQVIDLSATSENFGWPKFF